MPSRTNKLSRFHNSIYADDFQTFIRMLVGRTQLCHHSPATWHALPCEVVCPHSLDAVIVSCLLFWTILLGTRKMVRIGGIGLALSDPHFCILSRDCFNLSREYFSLWAIKTSLDRNASALLDPEVLFSRVARHLACLAFC